MLEANLRTVHAVMMGSDIIIKSYDADSNTLKKALQLIKHYEKKLSANREDSELMKINQMAGIAPVEVSPDMFELIEIAKNASLMPNTLFNLAIGPLVKLWKIGFDGNTIPNREKILQTLLKCDPHGVILNPDNHSVFLIQADMQIDLGAIAKGYIADLVRSYLESVKVKSALIDLGGNIHSLMLPNSSTSLNRSISHKDIGIYPYNTLFNHKHGDSRELWQVGLKTPFSANKAILGILTIQNESVVTTGIYERYFLDNNTHYHHILSSQTGFPFDNELVSVTVIALNSTEAEIWSTYLYGLGVEKGIKALSKIQHIEALFITRENKIVVSNHYKIDFNLIDKNYKII